MKRAHSALDKISQKINADKQGRQETDCLPSGHHGSSDRHHWRLGVPRHRLSGDGIVGQSLTIGRVRLHGLSSGLQIYILMPPALHRLPWAEVLQAMPMYVREGAVRRNVGSSTW